MLDLTKLVFLRDINQHVIPSVSNVVPRQKLFGPEPEGPTNLWPSLKDQ